jgi:hypothetical protein
MNQGLQFEKALQKLKKAGALAHRLSISDRAVQRIYVMGCARSGTWLLTGIMSTFADVSVLYEEVKVEYFGLLSTDRSTIVLKRHDRAYETIETIPPQISIFFIIRHPFDVLTSIHPDLPGSYYVTSGRWLGETMALKWLLDSRRPRTKIIRYEDLVTDPDRVQEEIASFANLRVQTPAAEFHKVFKPSARVIETMHTLRPPETTPIGRWKSDPDAAAHLRSLQLRLADYLTWIGRTFGYDMRLD